MGYIPSVQFAPFYVAQEKGYFKDAGLDVNFRYGFESDLLKLVGTNELPFMIGSGEEVILGRSQGLPVRYVMRWYRKFPVVLFAKAAKGIKSPADLVGKKVGLPGLFGASYVGWQALVSASGLDPAKVNLQSIGFTQACGDQPGSGRCGAGLRGQRPGAAASGRRGSHRLAGVRLHRPALERHHHQREDHQGAAGTGQGAGDARPCAALPTRSKIPMRRSRSA